MTALKFADSKAVNVKKTFKKITQWVMPSIPIMNENISGKFDGQ